MQEDRTNQLEEIHEEDQEQENIRDILPWYSGRVQRHMWNDPHTGMPIVAQGDGTWGPF